MPFPPLRRADWGNDQLKSFTAETAAWEHRVHAITADGYFKIAIRKHPVADACSHSNGTRATAL